MRFTTGSKDREQALTDLFTDTFTASEGAEAGTRIGQFVRALIATTPAGDLFAFQAYESGTLRGAIFFSRLSYPQDHRTVFILSPVAVDRACQGQGIGQQLIAHGLDALRAQGADIAMTYGDPAFYGKIGFRPVTEQVVPAPLPLNLPQGWLGQSLTDQPLSPLTGPATCVPALDDPELW
ncbi:N-acetyltransferase [Thalassovita sp.]|uniref:GNAT family N-acetyltransferase n=1 Tax=Thalassovita sp. TaxID=1979401 RepID=UPI0029DE769A|nr:N-acetyltransferase [Thalassovita sp.]